MLHRAPFLMLAVALWWTGAAWGDFEGQCGVLFEALPELFRSETPPGWPSSLLANTSVAAGRSREEIEQRVRHIVDEMYRPDSPMGREFDRVMVNGQYGNVTSLYLSAFDTYAFSPGYRDILRRSGEVLPARGRLLDLGAGSGVFSAALLAAGPGRQMLLVDRPGYEAIAGRRMRLVAGPGQYEINGAILGNADSRLPRAEGAVINQMLYTMPRVRQRAVLQAAFDALPRGGILVLNEPIAERVRGDESGYREWLTRQLVDGITNGAPQTEFQVAALAAFSARRIGRAAMGSTPPLHVLPRVDLERMARDEVKFEIDEARSGYGYDGFTRFLVLRKP